MKGNQGDVPIVYYIFALSHNIPPPIKIKKAHKEPCIPLCVLIV